MHIKVKALDSSGYKVNVLLPIATTEFVQVGANTAAFTQNGSKYLINDPIEVIQEHIQEVMRETAMMGARVGAQASVDLVKKQLELWGEDGDNPPVPVLED